MALLTGAVLGLLDSAPVTLAIVFGVPAAVALVVGLGVRRRTPVVVLLAGTLVVAGVAVLAVWAVFQEPVTSGATPGLSRPAGRPVDLTCAPAGSQVEETAQGIAFGKTCLAAPADQEFTIRFDNRDSGTAHNIHILAADPTSDPNARSLFEGELVTGPRTTTYQVSALPAGRYFFHCDVHPSQMFGGFVAG